MKLSTTSVFLLTSVALSSCTLSVRPGTGLAGSSRNLISSFTPDKGEGREYRVGESISFRVGVREAGYLTLIAMNPDGSANVLTQNAYIPQGTTVFPRPQDGVTYNVAPQRGIQRVRAIFTRVRPTTDLVLRGIYTENTWNAATNEYLQPYNYADRDIQETYIFIRN